MWTSIFGTYVRPGELLFMPFVEGYYATTRVQTSRAGYGLEQDFAEVGRWRTRSSWPTGSTTLRRGAGSRALHRGTLDKAPEDPSSMPARLEQSGFGDWQMELNWRAIRETSSHPEVFALLEVDPPSNVNKPLIGTANWESKLGVGVIRGLRWGTVSGRVG
jgi:hypothetical protein